MKKDTTEIHARSRGALVVAAAALGAAAAWLAFTARPEDWPQFFGRWDLFPFAVGLALGWVAVLALASRSRRALLACLCCMLVGGVLVGAAELAGLLGFVSYEEVFHPERKVLGSEAVPHLDVTGESREDLARIFGVDSEPIPFRYVTDRRGYRNAADRESADVYLLGDSILVAGLLPFEDTVTARLEELLGRTTMNVALVGIGPQEEVERFRAARLPVAGRLVLHFVFEGNDLLDSADYRRRQAAPEEDRGLRATFSYHAGLWLQRTLCFTKTPSQRRIGRIAGTDYLFLWTDRSFRNLEPEFEAVASALEDLHEEVTAAGGRSLVVYVPAKIRVLGPLCEWPPGSSLRGHQEHLSPLRDWLLERCRARGLDILDLTPPLEAAARAGTIPWFPADSHPNAAGHRIMAEVLAAHLAPR